MHRSLGLVGILSFHHSKNPVKNLLKIASDAELTKSSYYGIMKVTQRHE